jgi:FkbM family methyltransferase
MNLIAGYYWPEGDDAAGGYPNQQNTNFFSALQESHAWQYVQNFKRAYPGRELHTCVQAGGHVGIFPKLFAKHFKYVLTFEPDPENWKCLLKNLEGLENVRCCDKALGSTHDVLGLKHNKTNSGSSHITSDAPGKPAEFVVGTMPLDWLQLQSLDLLQLDVEGFEIPALEGAVDHIQRQRPLIICEANECSARYGRSTKDLVDWMKQHGYKQRIDMRNGHDITFQFAEDAG